MKSVFLEISENWTMAKASQFLWISRNHTTYQGSRVNIESRIFKIDIGSYKTIETARLFLLSENEKSKFITVKFKIPDIKKTDG